MKSLRYLIVGAAIAVGAVPAAAQSLFSTRGLGVPLAPLGARAQALGGIGVGLRGLNASLVNPAEIAGVTGRGAAIGFQPSTYAFEYGGERDVVGGTRFPLLHVVYPTATGFSGGIGYGAFLDQSWSVVSEGTATIGGQPVATRDLIESVGGVSQVRVALAYEFAPSFAVGVAAGALTGSQNRTLSRSFPDSAGAGLQGFRRSTRHHFSGPLAAFGVRWDPTPSVRLAGSVSWAGELRAEAVEGEATDRTYDLPWKVAVGASAVLAPRLLAVAGGEWAGWSSTRGSFDAENAVDDVWRVGGGLEWGGPGSGARTLPLRAGFRYGRLPFTIAGVTPTEWAASLGAGFRLAGDPSRPIAVLDAALERGARGDVDLTGLTETFWRVTVSMALFGL